MCPRRTPDCASSSLNTSAWAAVVLLLSCLHLPHLSRLCPVPFLLSPPDPRTIVSFPAQTAMEIEGAGEDEEHRGRRLSDFYDIHQEIGRCGARRSQCWGPHGAGGSEMSCSDSCALSPSLLPRGAFSYLRRVVERSSGLEFAAKFIPSQAKPKASARREARLLARLQHDCVLYFHEAFERRRGLVIVTELYPGRGLCLNDWSSQQTVCNACYYLQTSPVEAWVV